jgi:CBS domain containing-hemolysin-like protein
MTLLIVYITVALGVSFLCSIMEAALLSVTPSYVASLEKRGKKAGARLRDLKAEIDRPLAAILSLNTVAHTVGAAGAGAQAAVVFGSAYVGAASAILTLLILVLSEIVPKTLGAAYWRALAPMVALVLRPLIWAMYPLVKLSEGIAWLFTRNRAGISVSREEVAAMAELGAAQGVLAEGETKILRNLFRAGSLRVADIMTPRTVVYTLEESKTVGEVLEEQEENPFSRIPVYEKNQDENTGYVLRSDILLAGARDEMEKTLHELRRPIRTVSEDLNIPRLFELLLEHRDLIAVVVDEYGGMAGVVTMEDVVETLLGMEIVDEGDLVEDMRVLARRRWRARALELGALFPARKEAFVFQEGEEAGAGERGRDEELPGKDSGGE